MRAKSRLLQSGAYFHVCGLTKKEQKNPVLFWKALEKHGFVILELKSPMEGVDLVDFY